MDEKLNSLNERNEADRGWLAGWLLREGRAVLPRWFVQYQRLAQLPNRFRTRMQHKLALSLTGAALLLALAGPVGPSLIRAESDATEATINVVNGEVEILDNGKCSLIEAIINARATGPGKMKADCKAGNVSGADTISLPNGGLFELTQTHNTTNGPTGLPVITADMTIEGNGATIRRSSISGTGGFRILAVDPNVQLTLRDLSLRNGSVRSYDQGGAILSEGNLIIENSTIAGNRADYGGGVWATQATISGSQIVDNVSDARWGGLGGGLLVHNLTLINSVVAGNTAEGLGFWDYIGDGGGVAMFEGVIINSTISGNAATEGNYYYGPKAARGGGLLVFESATVLKSTISGNEATYGSGVYLFGDAHIVHSTISGNSAISAIGEGYGEGLSVQGRGGGIFVGQREACGSATIDGVVVSGNTAEGEAPEIWVAESDDDCTPTAISEGFNVIGHDGDAGAVRFTPGPNDVVPSIGVASILGPLGNNGGPTQTHALVPESPALDLAPSDSCMAPPLNGLDQRGQPRNANGREGASANECDAGSFELQATSTAGGAFLVSATGSGSVDGVAFAPSDILKFDPVTGWSMFLDASDVGVTRNLSAFEVDDDGDILMSFSANQVIAGVGTFRPQDIARFTPSALGPSTNGSFAWALDGSANWLNTMGEKIDAIADIGDGRIAISTMGNAAVKLPNGTVLKAQEEDALGINLSNGRWSAYIDGTAIPGLELEDVNAMWIDPTTGDIYLSVTTGFNIGGVKGDGKDIVKLTPSSAPGGYTASLWWDGSAAGFPRAIDGLELLR